MTKNFIRVVYIFVLFVLIFACEGEQKTDVDTAITYTNVAGPPSVTSTSPADNSTWIAVSSKISVTFNESMDIESVTLNFVDTSCSGSVQVSADDFSSCVVISLVRMTDRALKSFTIIPASDLANNTIYSIKITAAVKDKTGESLSPDYSWSFRTEIAEEDIVRKLPDTGQ